MIVQYIYTRGKGNKKKHGVWVAQNVGNNKFAIGYSLCNLKLDKFDRVRGIGLAKERLKAKGFLDIPESLDKEFVKFYHRAKRYFKGLTCVYDMDKSAVEKKIGGITMKKLSDGRILTALDQE